MPIYVYVSICQDGQKPEEFEFFQNMSDPAFENHPDTGVRIRRIPARTSIGGMWSDGAMKNSISDNKLAKHGFTKYVKSQDGKYEKTVGDGPSMISPDQ